MKKIITLIMAFLVCAAMNSRELCDMSQRE